MSRNQSGQKLRITAIEIWKLEGQRHRPTRFNWQHQVNPLHIYEEHRPKPHRDHPTPDQINTTVFALYLKIKTNADLEGLYGPIDAEIVPVINHQLSKFLLGKNHLEGERLWDQMFRLNRHARHGHFMMAISAIDNALWDLRGRYLEEPVYRLLGGPTRSEVEAYASCLGFSLEPEAIRGRSLTLRDSGFRYQKWFLAYGPGDGAAGLQENVALVKTLRETLGDDINLMFDAFMAWDLNYALAWAQQVESYRPYWIEEAFQPDKIGSFAQLRRSTRIPVAAGEHLYNRWEVHHYLEAGALNIVQADPEWCGGVSELVKICTTASLYDVQVIPHGHSLHAALHVVASQSPMTCPLVEYLINKMNAYHHFEKEPLQPVDGKIVLPERPGFGIELDSTKVERQSLQQG